MCSSSAPASRSAAPQAVVRSMTGFGRVVRGDAAFRVTAEVKAVNGRFLKLTCKLPPRYGAWEERIRALLARHGLTRGSVDAGIYLEHATPANAYAIHAEVAAHYVREARALAKRLRLKSSLGLADVLGLPGVVEQPKEEPDTEGAWALCEQALLEALAQLEEMRLREGATLAADVQARLDEMRAHHAALRHAAPASQQAAVARFKERIAQAVEKSEGAALEPGMLEREVVMLTDRLDLSEELARLGSHLDQMEATLRAGGEVGKKLDFLTQELLRETNTIGSKAQDQAIIHRAVDMKGLIEKIREQVQNLA